MIRFFKQYPYWLICVMAIVVVSAYWGVWASDRYVSKANVVLESPQIATPSFDFSSLISGNGGATADLLLLRDYMLSVDMLKKLDAELNLRGHYSQTGIDIFSRLFDKDAPIEELHEYYLTRFSVELDDYAHVLRIAVQAFDPASAYAMATLLLKEGEAHMNAMGQRLATEQVRFLDDQVARLSDRLDASRASLLNYQNERGLISPAGTVESLSAVVATLEGELARLRARKTAISNYQGPQSPEMVRVNNEINALRGQIDKEQARMAQKSGNALNRLSSEYQTLELKAQFALETYSSALAALENTRIEAARKLKQVSVLQSPTLPEYPIKPERLYNSVVFAIITIFLGFIVNMLVLIIKDHRD